MMLENANIKVEICEKTGVTTGIFSPNDSMNWVLENSYWGLVDNFEVKNVEKGDKKVLLTTEYPKYKLETKIEKEISDFCYLETYYITNNDTTEFFLTKENFAIPFPFDCLFLPERDILNNCCISHVWCGGDSAWISSNKCGGYAPYLVMDVTNGAIDDYSIKYDVSRVVNGSFFRGVIALHPRECVIMPNETIKLSFMFRFKDEKPFNAPLDFEGAIRFTADKYTANQGEEINLLFESFLGFENLKIICDGNEIDFVKDGKNAKAKVSFESLGERKILAEVDGKLTWVEVNIVLPIADILQRRARFIAEKQQYLKTGSHLDGAFLIYDSETNSKYYDNFWGDHNASRERISMGVVLCKALQQKMDEKLFYSLKKHREFVERELFDEESGKVYNDVAKSDAFKRFYNSPWVSTYYMEWFKLTGELKCLENSAKILIKHFEETDCKLEGVGLEVYKICGLLEENKLFDLRERLLELFLKFVNFIDPIIVDEGDFVSEISYGSGIPNGRLSFFSQAYLLTGEQKYLDKADDYFVKTKAYFGLQPNFHMNAINVSHWDRFWFGKRKTYGDLFPHYWTTLAGWSMWWYDKAKNSQEARKLLKSNLSNNLCVYRENGFAHNNYLFPYKVVQYTSNGVINNDSLTPGVTYGKNYDAWANDQDWSLYYASFLMN